MARHPNDPGPKEHRMDYSDSKLVFNEKDECFEITCDCLDCGETIHLAYVEPDIYLDNVVELVCEPEPPDRYDEMRDREIERELDRRARRTP